MAVAAETNKYENYLTSDVGEPLAIVVNETLAEIEARLRAAHFIGAVAAGHSAEVLPIASNDSLYEAVQRAANGDEQARKLITTNARTDLTERAIKSGHVMAVEQIVDEQGAFWQHGQSSYDVQANSLRYGTSLPQMRLRTEAETRNSFRLERLYKDGMLEDYSFVVFSRAADDMSIKDMRSVGFFCETMSCSIQVTKAENNKLVTESAFVSGIKEPGGLRHDEQTIVKLLQKIGVYVDGKTATELIDTPILIHNSLLIEGAFSLIELYDEAAGGTFCGESKPKMDHDIFKQICLDREERFAPQVERIVERLINEAPYIENEIQATARLSKISAEIMIEQAIGDNDIDPRVCGQAAEYLIKARKAYELGQTEGVIHNLQMAQLFETSASCPGAPVDLNSAREYNLFSESSCQFSSKECPVCHKKNVWTTVTKTSISGSCGCSRSTS